MLVRRIREQHGRLRRAPSLNEVIVRRSFRSSRVSRSSLKSDCEPMPRYPNQALRSSGSTADVLDTPLDLRLCRRARFRGALTLCRGREDALPARRQRVDERAHIAQRNRRTARDDKLWLAPNTRNRQPIHRRHCARRGRSSLHRSPARAPASRGTPAARRSD